MVGADAGQAAFARSGLIGNADNEETHFTPRRQPQSKRGMKVFAVGQVFDLIRT
jgi:hypothetical protein